MTSTGASSTSRREPLSEFFLRKALMAPRGPVSRLVVEDDVESTNDSLIDAVRSDPGQWDDLAVFIAERQSKGRGRLSRPWVAPARSSVLMSFLLRPQEVPQVHWTWLPMLGAVAIRRAIRQRFDVPAKLKWPNDVLAPMPDSPPVDGWGRYRKVAGVLAQLVEDGSGAPCVVLGIGINVDQQADELPVPWAASLDQVASDPVRRDVVLKSVVRAFVGEYQNWIDADGDAEESGLASAVRRNCVNIGEEVEATLPGEQPLRGRAETIDSEGRLVLRMPDGAVKELITADVLNVRTQ